jgi:flagellar basal-body rod protein FlgF
VSKIASESLAGGRKAQMMRMEVLTNNLANVSTPGYKTMRPVFHEVLAGKMSDGEDGKELPASSTAATFIDYSPASLLDTGGALDLAVEGPGFFVISTPEGLKYTRNGQFVLDKDQVLVTSKGYPVLGEGGKIFIDGREVRIETDGSVFVDRVRVGKIKVVDFKDRAFLQSAGMTLFANPNQDNKEIAPTGYSIRQRFIESSNVNITREMINIINCIRVYEAHKKASKSVDDAEDKMLAIIKKNSGQ